MVDGVEQEKDNFVKNVCEVVFDTEFLKSIKIETCHGMFCNWQGIMMSNGLIWIAEVLCDNNSQELKIVAFNKAL